VAEREILALTGTKIGRIARPLLRCRAGSRGADEGGDVEQRAELEEQVSLPRVCSGSLAGELQGELPQEGETIRAMISGTAQVCACVCAFV